MRDMKKPDARGDKKEQSAVKKQGMKADAKVKPAEKKLRKT